MIKITYKDYQIETDTVDQARWLMNEIGLPIKPEKRIVAIATPKRTYVLTGKYKKSKKGGTKHKWIDQEVLTIFKLLDQGVTGAQILKDEYLRQRHTKRAIAQMVYKIQYKRTRNVEVSRTVAQWIEDWHKDREARGVKLEVKHE